MGTNRTGAGGTRGPRTTRQPMGGDQQSYRAYIVNTGMFPPSAMLGGTSRGGGTGRPGGDRGGGILPPSISTGLQATRIAPKRE